MDLTPLANNLSVIIPHFGSYTLLRNCLDSLQFTSVENIIVVEDGCYDPTIQEDYPDVQFERLKTNSGFAVACNHGLERVQTPFVAILNNDVQVTPKWHLPILEVLESHPDIAVCQPKIKSAQNPQLFDYAGGGGGFLDQYGYPFCRGRIFDVIENDRGQYDNPCDIFWASGAAFVARTEDVRRAGGFDPIFFAYMEEIDLCWRLQALGKRIVFVPESEVYHEGSASWASMPLRKAYLLHRNNLLLLLKNYSRRDLLAILWTRILLELGSTAFFLVRGEVRRSAAILRALAWNLAHYRELKERYHGRVGGPSYKLSRRQDLACLYRSSIALQHFLGGVNHFDELDWEIPTLASSEGHQPDDDLASG
ncbi:MAG: glycosyltransferase family 2 protein [Thermoplasmata archaeon]